MPIFAVICAFISFVYLRIIPLFKASKKALFWLHFVYCLVYMFLYVFMEYTYMAEIRFFQLAKSDFFMTYPNKTIMLASDMNHRTERTIGLNERINERNELYHQII